MDKCLKAIDELDKTNGDDSGRGVVLIPVCEEILGVITANTMKEYVLFIRVADVSILTIDVVDCV